MTNEQKEQEVTDMLEQIRFAIARSARDMGIKVASPLVESAFKAAEDALADGWSAEDAEFFARQVLLTDASPVAA